MRKLQVVAFERNFWDSIIIKCTFCVSFDSTNVHFDDYKYLSILKSTNTARSFFKFGIILDQA